VPPGERFRHAGGRTGQIAATASAGSTIQSHSRDGDLRALRTKELSRLWIREFPDRGDVLVDVASNSGMRRWIDEM
jgi:hypothetical protein